MNDLPMKPAGYLMSVLTLPSILMRRWAQIFFASVYVNAYLSRLRKKMTVGKLSRNLCGPGLGFGANTPDSLSNIHCFGAYKRFKCFRLPRTLN
jgi:hypothetical protein